MNSPSVCFVSLFLYVHVLERNVWKDSSSKGRQWLAPCDGCYPSLLPNSFLPSYISINTKWYMNTFSGYKLPTIWKKMIQIKRKISFSFCLPPISLNPAFIPRDHPYQFCVSVSRLAQTYTHIWTESFIGVYFLNKRELVCIHCSAICFFI